LTLTEFLRCEEGEEEMERRGGGEVEGRGEERRGEVEERRSSRGRRRREDSIQFSIQFICIAQFHKLQICLGVLYNLYT